MPYQSAYDTDHASLRRQILRECEEMAEFAFASGMRVPASVMQVVEAAVATSVQAKSGGSSDEPYDPTGEEIKRLVQAHEQLGKVVAPATPRALVILADHRHDGGVWGALGPVPFIRHMMVVAILSLLTFILLVATPEVDGDVQIIPAGAFGKTFLNELFLISAAALGASFAALFQANQYIGHRNYDPQYEISYWIKFVVGMMAGLMLALLIPLDLGDPATREGIKSAASVLDKPLLALIGGFSASAVYRILNRLVETVESLVRGNAKEMVSAAQEQARLQTQAQTEQMRLRMASSLLSLQQELGGGGDPASVKARMDAMLNSLVPDRIDDGRTAFSAPADSPPEAPGAAPAVIDTSGLTGLVVPSGDAPPVSTLLMSEVADDPSGFTGEAAAPNLHAYGSEDESDGEDHAGEDDDFPAPAGVTVSIGGARQPDPSEAVG
jgi:hypothetical protein